MHSQIVAAASIRGRRLFEGGVYSRAASIRGNTVLVAMQVNCGFARVAMLELSRVPTGQSRDNLDKEPSEKF